MSQTIDEKVVELRFDNKQFEDGVKESLSTLDKLKNSIKTNISSKSFDNVQKSVKNIDLSNLERGVEALSSRFSTFGIVGMEVIKNITDGLMGGLVNGIHAATNAIVSGGIKRAMNIENAHFQLQGLIDDEQEVQAIMDDAMQSVDGTAYAYDEAAKAASMFAASGLKSGEGMQKALMGIAGTAATTNAEYQRVADIFTKVAGKGRIQAMELNQFAAMGMNAAAAITKYFNQVTQEGLEASDSVKSSIQTLTGGLEVTEETIREFVSKGNISFEIFSEAMATSFGEHAKDANKTFTGSMANIRAALARTGAMFVSPLVKQDGPFVQFFNAVRIKVNEFNKALGAANGMAAKFTTWINDMITKLTKVVEGFKIANVYTRTFKDGVTSTFESSTKSMMKWGDKTEGIISGSFYTPFHAFQDIVYTIVNSIKGLLTVIKPIGEAFKETFSFNVENVYKAIESIRKFSSTLKLSEKNSKNVHDAFKGLFDIIKLGFTLIGRLVGALSPLATRSEKISDSFFDLGGNIGRSLSKFAEMASNSESLGKVFTKINTFVNKAIDAINHFIDIIKNGVHLDFSWITKLKEEIKGTSSVFDVVANGIKKASKVIYSIITSILSKLGSIGSFIKNILDIVAPTFKNLLKTIAKVVAGLNPIKAFFSLLNGILSAGLIVSIKRVFDSLNKGIKILNTKGLIPGFLSGVNQLTTTVSQSINRLTTMLSKDLNSLSRLIDAKALKEIAISVGILSASLLVLSSIDSEALGRSLAAISTMMIELVGTMVILSKAMSTKGLKSAFGGLIDSAKINVMASTLIKFAAAILILSFAMKNLASLSWEEIIKGLAAITVLMLEMIGAVELLSLTGGDKKLKSVGAGMVLLAIAINIMAKAVIKLSSLKWEEIGKGLAVIGGLMLEMALFTMLTGGSEKMMSIGVGMVLLAAAIRIISKAVSQLSGLSWEEIDKGLSAVGGLILEMALFTMLTGGSKKMISTALAMVILSQSLKMMSDVLLKISSLSWEEIAKGLSAIGGALLEMTIAMNFLPNTGILKAAGILVLAFAMQVLSEALQAFGKMSWEELARGLVAMGGALLEIGIALNAIPAWAVLGATGLLVTAVALTMVAKVMQSFGGMSWEEIARGLAAMGGALLEIGIALYAIPPWAILGAAGLLVTAIALTSIAKSMQLFGGMSWEEIARGLVAMGGALAEIVIAMQFATSGLVGAAALLVIAIALEKITPAFIALGQMEWAQIGKACVALVAALAILVTAMVALGAVASYAIPGALALLAFAVSLSLSVVILSKSIDILVAAIDECKGIDPQTFLSTTKMLALAIGMLGLALSTFGITAPLGAIALRTTAQALLILYPAIVAFSTMDGNLLSKTFILLAKGIAKFGLALKTFGPLANIGASAFNTIADAISKLAPAMIIFTNLNLNKVAASLKVIARSFKDFGPALKSFGLFSNVGAKAMNTVADAISKLAPAMVIFMAFDPNRVSSTMTLLADSFKKFGEALDSTPFWGSGMRAKGIGALIDNIPKLTETLPAFMELDANGVSTAMKTISDGFVKFAEAIAKTPFWGSDSRAKGIGALIDNIPKLTETLPAFMELDANAVKNSMEILGNGFKNFGEALQAAPLFTAEDRGEGIKILVESISTLSSGISDFMKVNFDGIGDVLSTISTAFTNFGNALSNAPLFNADERGEGIATIVDSISVLADGITKFVEIKSDADTISTILTTVGDAFFDFGTALSTAPLFNANERSTALVKIVESVNVLVNGIERLASLSNSSNLVKDILGAVGTAFIDFGEALKKTPFWGTTDRTNALVQVANSLNTLGTVLINLNNNLNPGQISTLIGLMASSIKMFGSALNDYGAMSETYAQVFTVLVNGMSSIGSINSESFLANIQALKELIEVIKSMATVNVDSMNNFANGLSDLGSNALAGFISAFNTDSGNATTSVTNFINNICVILQSRNTDIHKYGAETAEEWLKGIATKYSMATATGKKLGEQVLSALRVLYTQFKQVGTTSAQQYAQGINNMTKYVKSVAEGLAQTACNGLNPTDPKTGKSKFYDVGQKAAQGYIDGMKSKEGEAKAAGEGMGDASQEGTKTKNEQKSPSRAFRRIGNYAGEGYVIGMREWAKDAYNAGKELAAASQAGIGMDDMSEPIIRPVVDLENVFDAANTVNQMFSSAMMSTMVRTNAAGGSMVSSTSNNPDEKFQNGQNPSGNNYTFNQYNTSPKALSRIEIYRDTKSLMQSYREAVERA